MGLRRTRLTIRGFKSIREMDLKLGHLNVLIGANGKPKGPYCNLNENEAALLIKEINPRVAIPMHYGLFEYVHEDPQKFVDALKRHKVPVECIVMESQGCYVYKE